MDRRKGIVAFTSVEPIQAVLKNIKKEKRQKREWKKL